MAQSFPAFGVTNPHPLTEHARNAARDFLRTRIMKGPLWWQEQMKPDLLASDRASNLGEHIVGV